MMGTIASMGPDAKDGVAPTFLVFDTDCVLCSGFVAFVLARERDHLLHFVGAWSPEGLALAKRHGYTRADLNETFLVLRGDEALAKSDAGLAVIAHFRDPWRWLSAARVIPRPLRDALYVAVARRRYRWFGKRTACTIVPPEQAHRFIGVTSAPLAGRETSF